MIAFGAAMTDPEAYRRYAQPGIERAAEPSSEVFAIAAAGTICRSYNLLLDLARKCEGLEALVLVAQETEITDPNLLDRVREAIADPGVALVGCAGATGVRSIAWWEGQVSIADVRHAYNEEGGGELPAFSWADHEPPPRDVDSLDGMLLVLSPWAAQNLRFDESLALGFGYDLDFCLQAREAGKRVRTADLRVRVHQPLDLVDDLDLWIEGHVQAAEKWEGRMPDIGKEAEDWKTRARRAEAEREAARTIAYSTAHGVDARLAPRERELHRLTGTAAWKATAPLRHANRWRLLLAERVRVRRGR